MSLRIYVFNYVFNYVFKDEIGVARDIILCIILSLHDPGTRKIRMFSTTGTPKCLVQGNENYFRNVHFKLFV